jgi:hypothetical protein
MSDAPAEQTPGAEVPTGDELIAAGAAPAAADADDLDKQIADLQAKRDALNAAAAAAPPAPAPVPTFRDKLLTIGDVAVRDALGFIADHLNL